MSTPGSSTGSSESTAASAEQTSSSRGKRRGRPPGSKDGPGVRRPQKKLNPEFLGRVAALRAEGLPATKVAKALETSIDRVKNALALPETQLEIVKRREIAKSVAAHFIPSVTAGGFALAQEAIESGDAKSFDAATRGLHALEKIGASVSGEDRKFAVEHSGSVETTPQQSAVEQLNVLIGVILGNPRHPQPATARETR